MPWKIVADHASCPISKPYGVVKQAGGKVVGCHPSKTAAQKHLAALYASEPNAASRRSIVTPNQRPPLAGVREAPFTLAEPSGDGLTLDGYAAVFNNPTVIDSWEGRFREQIAPGAMKRSFRETPPKIQFDHGRHPMIGSIPIAALTSATEDVRGAHIVGRVFDNWLMQPVRDAIAAEVVNGMSFRFTVVREAWSYADGTPIKGDHALMAELDRSMSSDIPENELPIRTLQELKVPEVGPVVWPAYEATSVGMRSKTIDLSRLSEPGQRKLLAEAVFIADQQAVTETRQTEGDDDPAALASAVDAILDQAAMLIADVDLSTLPPEVAQACALITAAETAADDLLEAMGVYDPDDDEANEPSSGRSRDVDAQQPTATAVGEHPSQDAQRDTADTVVKRPSHKTAAGIRRLSDAQQATPDVGERPPQSKPRGLRAIDLVLRNQRDALASIERSRDERSSAVHRARGTAYSTYPHPPAVGQKARRNPYQDGRDRRAG